MNKKVMGLFAVLAISSMAVQAVEYAVYDGKANETFVSAPTNAPAVLGRGSESFVLIVNRDTGDAAIVSWGKGNPGTTESVTANIGNYTISGKETTKAIASRDVVSMTIGTEAVLLGTLSSSTPIVDGVEDVNKRKVSASLRGSSIDGTATAESFGALALKYNLKVSQSVNGEGGQAAIDAYVSSKTKGAVAGVTLP